MSREIVQQSVFKSCQMNRLSVFTHAALFAVKFYMVGNCGIHSYNCFAFRAKSNNALGKWQYPSGFLFR